MEGNATMTTDPSSERESVLERQKSAYIAARDVYMRANIELREQIRTQTARIAELEAMVIRVQALADKWEQTYRERDDDAGLFCSIAANELCRALAPPQPMIGTVVIKNPPVSFEYGCMCGGYAWRMNGRDPKQPHMDWCPQHAEYAEYVAKFGIPGQPTNREGEGLK